MIAPLIVWTVFQKKKTYTKLNLLIECFVQILVTWFGFFYILINFGLKHLILDALGTGETNRTKTWKGAPDKWQAIYFYNV